MYICDFQQSGPTHVGNCYRCAAVLQTAHQAADHHTSVPVILQMLDLDLDIHILLCVGESGDVGGGVKEKRLGECTHCVSYLLLVTPLLCYIRQNSTSQDANIL